MLLTIGERRSRAGVAGAAALRCQRECAAKPEEGKRYERELSGHGAEPLSTPAHAAELTASIALACYLQERLIEALDAADGGERTMEAI